MHKDKTTLCRQLRYIDISTLQGQIGQNDKVTPCRHLGYFDRNTLRGSLQ
jgi:hypothetical protein